MRTPKAEALAGLPPEVIKTARKIANNTWRYHDTDDSIVIRLHRTNIIRSWPDGRTRLTSGGWQTYTTRDRLNTFMPAGYRLYQRDYVWYVVRMSDEAKVEFFDGMELPSAFEREGHA